MKPNIDTTDLRKIIVEAEEELEKLKEDDRRRFKQRRITKALERAYNLLNKKEYTQKEVDKRTRDVWRSLQDGLIPPFLFFLFDILFVCAFVFAVYEAYSFMRVSNDNRPPVIVDPGHGEDNPGGGDHGGGPDAPKPHEEPKPEKPEEPPKDDENKDEDKEDIGDGLVTVHYKETNIVSLHDQIPVDDEIGLKNTPQEFTITNDSSKMPEGVNYRVNYEVNIVEYDTGAEKVIDKNYLRYRLTYQNENGEYVTVDGRFSDLKQKKTVSYKYQLITASQLKDASSDFKMVIWLDKDAGNDQQGAAYTFSFNVEAAVEVI